MDTLKTRSQISVNLGRVQAFDDSMPAQAERLAIMFRNLLTAKQVVWVYAFAWHNQGSPA